MKKLLVLAGLSAILLAGCKVEVDTQVALSELLGSQSKELKGNIAIEVMSCNDYQDSRKPSKALLEAQKVIPSIFTDAEYVECYSKRFNSYAVFSTPIYLDVEDDRKYASYDHINLISIGSRLLSVGIPNKVKARIDSVQKQSMVGPALNLDVSVKVVNDLGRDYSFSAIAVYIDEHPHVFSEVQVHKDKQFTVRLSDVSVSQAMQSASALILTQFSED